MDNGTHARSGRLRWWAVAAATVLGGALRLYKLGAQSFWVDECLTVFTAGSAGAEFWTRVVIDNSNTPLYFLVIRGVRALFGETEFVLRLPSAIAGALTIPVAAAFIHAVTRERRATVLFALLLALNPLHIWFSQEARPYAVLLLIGSATLWAWQTARRTGRASAWIAYTAGSVLCFLTHKAGLVFPAAAVLATCATRGWRSHLKPLAASCAAIAAVALPVIVWMARFPMATSVDRALTGMEIPYTFFCYVGGFSFGPPVRALQALGPAAAVRQHMGQVVIGGIALVALGIAGVLNIRRCRPTFVILLAAPLLLTLLNAVLTGYSFYVRYSLPGLIGFLGLASVLLSAQRRAGVVILVYLLGVAAVADRQWFTSPAYGKNDTRAAVERLGAALPDNATIAVAPGYSVSLLDYYAGREGRAWTYTPVPPGTDAAFDPAPDALVVTREHHVPNADALIQRFSERSGNVIHLEASGYRLFVRRKGAPRNPTSLNGTR
jgi:mannosyltransferase